MGKLLEISDVIGQTFGRLTAMSESEKVHGRRAVHCHCLCGNTNFKASINALRRGNTNSCGCIRKERNNNYKDGRKHHPLYTVYHNIIARCTKEKYPRFKDYGGRGIDVCEEWMADVGVFIAWCEANGYREGLEIDRIDNNSGYRPDNCRFVTRKQNMWNIRKNFLLDFSGERKPLAQWCNELGLNYSRTYQRLHKLNMPVEKAFLQTALRNTHV